MNDGPDCPLAMVYSKAELRAPALALLRPAVRLQPAELAAALPRAGPRRRAVGRPAELQREPCRAPARLEPLCAGAQANQRIVTMTGLLGRKNPHRRRRRFRRHQSEPRPAPGQSRRRSSSSTTCCRRMSATSPRIPRSTSCRARSPTTPFSRHCPTDFDYGFHLPAITATSRSIADPFARPRQQHADRASSCSTGSRT